MEVVYLVIQVQSPQWQGFIISLVVTLFHERIFIGKEGGYPSIWWLNVSLLAEFKNGNELIEEKDKQLIELEILIEIIKSKLDSVFNYDIFIV